MADKKYLYFVIKQYLNKGSKVSILKKIQNMPNVIYLDKASQHDLICLYNIGHPFIARKEIKEKKEND